MRCNQAQVLGAKDPLPDFDHSLLILPLHGMRNSTGLLFLKKKKNSLR